MSFHCRIATFYNMHGDRAGVGLPEYRIACRGADGFFIGFIKGVDRLTNQVSEAAAFNERGAAEARRLELAGSCRNLRFSLVGGES